MFSIPTIVDSLSLTDAIFIDEKAEVLACVIRMIVIHRIFGDDGFPDLPITALHGALAFCDKFDVQGIRGAVRGFMNEQLATKPYEAFAMASKEDNQDLGKRSIRFMNPTPNFDLWKALSSADPHWQIALIKMMVPLPAPSDFYLKGMSQSRGDYMREMSKEFNPE
jgi:hypothetical protein